MANKGTIKTIKDKLDLGLKPEAPYRPENLPEIQQDDPDCQKGAEPGEGPEQETARDRCDQGHGRSRVRVP